MPRFYNSLADAQTGIQGHKGRAAAAAAIRAQEEARRADPRVLAVAAARRHASETHRLSGVIAAAEDKLDGLQAKLDAARSRVGRLDEVEFATGSISDEARATRAQVEGLPRLIARAADELQAARDALVAHHARAEPVQDEPAAPAAVTKLKGRRS